MREWKTRYKAILTIAIMATGNVLFVYAWTHTSIGPSHGNVAVIIGTLMTMGGGVSFLIAVVDRLRR